GKAFCSDPANGETCRAFALQHNFGPQEPGAYTDQPGEQGERPDYKPFNEQERDMSSFQGRPMMGDPRPNSTEPGMPQNAEQYKQYQEYQQQYREQYQEYQNNPTNYPQNYQGEGFDYPHMIPGGPMPATMPPSGTDSLPPPPPPSPPSSFSPSNLGAAAIYALLQWILLGF
ncbi:MAG: hypothetical protein G01um101456_664, partial [Parcubacteria group bacterium Gr01-1014_56]